MREHFITQVSPTRCFAGREGSGLGIRFAGVRGGSEVPLAMTLCAKRSKLVERSALATNSAGSVALGNDPTPDPDQPPPPPVVRRLPAAGRCWLRRGDGGGHLRRNALNRAQLRGRRSTADCQSARRSRALSCRRAASSSCRSVKGPSDSHAHLGPNIGWTIYAGRRYYPAPASHRRAPSPGLWRLTGAWASPVPSWEPGAYRAGATR